MYIMEYLTCAEHVMYIMEYLTRTEESVMYIMECLTCAEEHVYLGTKEKPQSTHHLA